MFGQDLHGKYVPVMRGLEGARAEGGPSWVGPEEDAAVVGPRGEQRATLVPGLLCYISDQWHHEKGKQY
jgi:hypothetical protein